MSAVLVFVAPLVLILFVASANWCVWFHRREELRHRALALASLAGSLALAANGLMYASDSRGEAVLARTAVFAAGVPIYLGSVRFIERVYDLRLPHYRWLGAAGGIVWALLGLVPGVLYGDGTRVRGTGALGLVYTDVELTPLGAAAPIALLAVSAMLMWRARRAGRGDARSALIGATLATSGAALACDMGTLAGWLELPFVYPLALSLMNVVFTMLMLRRFVATLERVEASADLLQVAAEARARELRETDLRLAHGARLAALGTLAAGLAHEINNPVAFIRSNLNYLADLARQEGDEAELEEVLAETEEGVARLRGIVDELLRMSSQGSAGFGELLLSEVVESALPTLRFEAGDDVAIRAQLAPVPPVRGDRNLLGQVVANLVINAIQAVRAAGDAGEVRIATFADDRRAVLEVCDSGPGVAPAVAPRIFEPFFTTKPAGQGTGLGLAVTRQLVERHGGRVTLVPSERGARFRVELPLAGAPARAEPEAAGEAGGAGA